MTTTMDSAVTAPVSTNRDGQRVVGTILIAITGAHFLNDLIQSVLVGDYSILQDTYSLSYSQIGLITLANQVSASLLQPLVGMWTDRHPSRYALSLGMVVTCIGLAILSSASSFALLLVAASLVGMGSAVFHPEASRMARQASGGRYGLAQSVFQVGGNLGSSLGPLIAALVILPRGQGSIRWFCLVAVVAMIILFFVGAWHSRQEPFLSKGARKAVPASTLPRRRVAWALSILGILVFSKFCYLVSLTTYYPFYLQSHFHLSIRSSEVQLFVFLLANAAGTVIGGPIGDRIGRKRVIWASILGVAPFTLALPWAGLLGTEILAVVIGVILASAFSAILVFAQELVPGRVGLVSGLFFGLAFGVAGIAAAVLGSVADHWGLDVVYRICSFLPLAGLATIFLPDLGGKRQTAR